jgi:hypothetical protein
MTENKGDSEQEPEPGILLVLFDINGSRDENNNNENCDSQNLLENPNSIIKEFFSNHQILNLETKQIKPSELLYKFKVDLYDSSLFQMIVINNLSFIHEISLEADGFLIFLNLEDEKTEDKLAYLIKFMTDSCCSGEKKINFVGLYKNEILPQFKKKDLENYFGEHNLNFDYYEIKYNDNEKKHNCLYESTNKKKTNENKEENKEHKEHKEHNLQEVIEKVTIDTYENKMSVIYIPDKKKFIKKKEKNNDNSNSRCIII